MRSLSCPTVGGLNLPNTIVSGGTSCDWSSGAGFFGALDSGAGACAAFVFGFVSGAADF